MPDTLVLKFTQMEWDQVGEYARQKVAVVDGRRIRLLQLLPGFQEPDWCRRGHLGFVVDGTLEIEFPDGARTFAAGDGLAVPAGVQHKAQRATQRVTLFLVDED
jgi:hypothetical protein